MKKIVMTFLTALAAGCADHTMPVAQLPEIDTNNPLLAEWNTPHETPVSYTHLTLPTNSLV